jgi:hypothetical protein
MDQHRNALKPGYQLHWYLIREILGQGGFRHPNIVRVLTVFKETTPPIWSWNMSRADRITVSSSLQYYSESHHV